MGAYGLNTYIWNNNIKSIVLLALFPVLIIALTFAVLLLYAGFVEGLNTRDGLAFAAQLLPPIVPFALLGVAAWFCVAFFGHQFMIDASTHAHTLSRSQEPRAYKLLENLCISRGVTTPKLKVIETGVLNAYASGIREKQYTVTLTRGLMKTLDDEELEAVIAHELTHIRNRDVRLLVISVVFVGIISFCGELAMRGMFRTNMPRTSRSRRGGEVNAAALIFIAFAIVAIAYVLAIVTRFALSRRREYLADAGAVELTKNPDAMIRALQKISGRAKLNAPAEVREMAFENRKVGFSDMFSTHPPIEKRIQALVDYGGGRNDTQSRPPRRSGNFAQARPHPQQRRPFGQKPRQPR